MHLFALLLFTASVSASLNGGDRASRREVVPSPDQGSAARGRPFSDDDLLLNDRPLLTKNDRMKRDRWTDQSIDDEYWPYF
uniref:Neuropeptide n=1 Tax=Haemonchus contortus TaxID=6289 RepID=A0A7I4YLL1_HAECO